ncbi:MAG: hypothetical protein HGA84_03655, partial [Syntrophobacteraceae bacterium]|nr:hypothetical protein [Syntrophobacteraceae bacterium]
KVPAEDFLRSPDAFVMDYLGGGFLRWFFNPWGEALSRLHAAVPDTSFWWKALRVLTHIAHTSMSTYGWSFAFPGWLLWDREFTGEGPHVSYTEQEASERSGELYTPVGRLFGAYEENDDDEPRFTVGDVMRYYYYAENDMAMATSTQDRAGVPFNATPRVVPDVPSDPGRAVPDFLFAKNNANPYDWGDTSPGENNFFPDVNGWIPIGERVEMASAAYVAFTRPGTHRVTVSPTTGGFAEAGEAQDAGLQRLFYNCEVRDVTARVAGQRVLNDATVRLVRGQRARVRVSPNDGRNYGVALLRPQNGELLRLADDGRIVARDASGSEPAQVNRVYSADELFTHLQRPLVVPVREFTIEVTSQLPVLTALPSGPLASLGALPLDNLFDPLPQNPRPGESVFVIVPVHVEVPLEPDGSTLGGVTEPAVVGEATPAVLRDFVGDGVIYRVTFDAGSIPANPVAIRFTVTVSGETPIPLETTITLQPA